MKLTESQARRAIRKWLFEYNTDSGVSRRPSTDDKVAGTLGDDRLDTTIPQELPIMAMNQMANQLTVEAPPIEDPEWLPANEEELARAAYEVSKNVPPDEIEWYYQELLKAMEGSLERRESIAEPIDSDDDIKNQIRVQKSSPESIKSANESKLTNRWLKILQEGISVVEAYNKPGKMTRKMKTKKLTPQDMKLHRPSEEEIWEDILDQADYDESGFMPDEDMIEDFVRSSNPNATEEEIQAEIESMSGQMATNTSSRQLPSDYDPTAIDADFDENARLRQLRDSGVIPNVSTLSGTKKWITANIDAFVAMWFNANKFTRHVQKFVTGQAPWGPEAPLNGPKIYLEATEAAGFYNPEELEELKNMPYEDLISGAAGTYSAIMNKFVTAPILAKWKKEVAAGNINADEFVKAQINNADFGNWINDAVIRKWNTGRARRQRAEKANSALVDHASFLETIKSPIFYEYDPDIPKDADKKIDELKADVIEKLSTTEEN